MRTQFAALLSARILGSALQALLFVLLARESSVPLFGLVGLLMGVGQFAATVLDLGMSTYIARARARSEHSEVASGLYLNVWGTSVLAIGATLLAWALAAPYGAPLSIVLLGVGVALEKNVETGMAVAIADGMRWTMPISVVLRRGSNVVLFLSLVAAGVDSISSFALSYVASGIAGQIHLRVFLSRYGRLPSRAPWRGTLKSSLPFLINNVSAQARLLDSTVLAIAASPVQVGLYSAASRLSNPLLMIPATMTTLLLPHAARQSIREVRTLAIRMGLAMSSLYVPLIIASVLSPHVLAILLGERYVSAAPALAAAWLSLPGVALSSPLASLLQAGGRESEAARNALVFAGILILGMVVGATVAGAAGVAAGVGLAYVAKCIHLYILLLAKKN